MSKSPSATCPLPLAGPVFAWIACALLAALLQSGTALAANAKKKVVGENFIISNGRDGAEQGVPGTTDVLQGYVHHLLDKKYVRLKELYATPISAMSDYSYDILTPTKATPVMATRVTAAAGDRTGLAVAVQGGKVFVFGTRPCKRLGIPGAEITRLGYDKASPAMALFDAGSGRVASVDLEKCEAVVVADGLDPDGISSVHVSPDGRWVAAVASDYRILAGPAAGPLAPGPELSADPVMVAFTPGRGIMALLEPSGRLVFWALPSARTVREFTVPGGPFVQGALHGYVLEAQGADGRRVCMNIVKQSPEQCGKSVEEPARVLEKKGDKLYFRTGLTRWNMSNIMGYLPQMYLYHSRSRNALKLEDLDGETRYYDASTGRLTDPVSAMDWDAVRREEGGLYHVGKDAYRLADLVAHQEGLLRFSRHVPGKGFYLWWEPAGELDRWVRYPGSLPVRTSIKADAPAHWLELRGGSLP